MTEENKTKSSEEHWIKTIALESFQPELVISGFAIFTTFSLIYYITNASNYWYLNGNYSIVSTISLIEIYMQLAMVSLFLNFVIHFMLRTLWVGMIGLISVFPNGINREKLRNSDHFNDQLLNEFPDIKNFTLQLDKICSVIFAFSCSIAGIFISISFLLCVIILCTVLLVSLFPDTFLEASRYIPLAIISLVFVPTILIGILNIKKIRDKSWVKKVHYPLHKGIMKVLYLFFYKPAIYIQYTFNTNVEFKKMQMVFLTYFIFVAVAIFAFKGIQDNHSLESALNKGNKSESILNAKHYLDQNKPNQYIGYPIIQSTQITSDQLVLFIPYYGRQKTTLDQLYGSFSKSDEADRKKKNYITHTKDQLSQYYQLFLDSIPVSNPDFLWYTHENKNEKGIISYLPIDHLSKGKHILRIEKERTEKEKEEEKTTVHAIIPFWIGED